MATGPKPAADSLGRRLAELAPEKREVLERLIGGKRSAQQRIPQRPSCSTAPLSFAQQRLWFFDQVAPGNPVYNEAPAIRISSAVDPLVLERSLNEVIRRHEVLRTVFRAVNGEPVQEILPELHLSLDRLDVSHLPQHMREAEAQRLATESALQPFDLTKGPLLRALLIRLAESDYILSIAVHHIVYDGWSMPILFGELSTLNAAFAAGLESPLEPLPIQYADFAVWQRQWLQGEVLERQLEYWKKQLDGAPPLALPLDHPRPAVQSYRGAVETFRIPEPMTAELRALSHAESATLFITLLAAFQVLLARYTGQDDIVVGAPVANRMREELEGLIGFFVNTLVMRADLSGDPSFREALRRLRQVALDAYAHQDLPFERLVEEVRADRDLSHNPLFQVTFQEMSGDITDDNDGPAAPQIEIGAAKFDLRLDIIEDNRGLLGRLEYSTDLFEPETIRRMAGHFRTLIEAIAANPDARIWDLPLLTGSERTQLLEGWSRSTSEPPAEKCIHQLFEAQAARTPDAVALEFGSERLTYAELDRRANQLAHYLTKRGIGPDALAGISMERSCELIVAVLGVLKSGGAYVPLDPEYPKERLAFMLRDSRVRLLLTQGRLRSALLPSVECVRMDEDWPEISREPCEAPVSRVLPSNLAYVIYTSGSTGKPKGVLVEHRGACNVSEAVSRIVGISTRDRVLQFASLSFDASMYELLMALPWGATLVLARPEEMLPGPALTELVRSRRISFVLLPPSALPLMSPRDLPSLATITVTGEPVSQELVKHWAAGRRFFNLYGPTEATILTTVDECSPERRNTIGRPIRGAEVYVLDQHLQPVPAGVPGELYIGGIGVSRGYLNQPDVTAKKFIANPFRNDPADRLYRTGDLVRYLPGGRLDFLSRLDHQVKIRGFRIETGEVEAVIKQHPAVVEAIVMAREDAPGEKRLVGYIVPRRQDPEMIHELRDLVRQKLPRYMMPAAFVLLDAMPLSPNGKVDRALLPQPSRSRTEAAYAGPGTALQKEIAQAWREVLGLDKVGAHDNFFDIGGHSLLIVRLHAALERALNVKLSIVDLFRYPTVSLQAEHIGNVRGAGRTIAV